MKKVAIVEDDVFMREELEDILIKEGYCVFCITRFDDTVKTILRESPGLVILDINLPGATGFDICRQLKKLCPVPVLVLTSRAVSYTHLIYQPSYSQSTVSDNCLFRVEYFSHVKCHFCLFVGL